MSGYRSDKRKGLYAVLATLLLVATGAQAHHSNALFYNVEQRITVTGKVTDFRFTNPHAILHLAVTGSDGQVQAWTAETSSPSSLRRRGWSQDSFMPGETVKIEGMPSRDGSWLMRITRAWKEDGTEIGVPAPTGANE